MVFGLCNFCAKLSWLQRRGNKLNTRIYDDIIYKTVKPSHLEKLEIIRSINNLMFQVIFIFSAWILIKQIKVFSTHFCCWGETDFQKILVGVLSGERGHEQKMPRFNAFSMNVIIINLNFFHIHGGIYTLRENSTSILEREIKP